MRQEEIPAPRSWAVCNACKPDCIDVYMYGDIDVQTNVYRALKSLDGTIHFVVGTPSLKPTPGFGKAWFVSGLWTEKIRGTNSGGPL